MTPDKLANRRQRAFYTQWKYNHGRWHINDKIFFPLKISWKQAKAASKHCASNNLTIEGSIQINMLIKPATVHMKYNFLSNKWVIKEITTLRFVEPH